MEEIFPLPPWIFGQKWCCAKYTQRFLAIIQLVIKRKSFQSYCKITSDNPFDYICIAFLLLVTFINLAVVLTKMFSSTVGIACYGIVCLTFQRITYMLWSSVTLDTFVLLNNYGFSKISKLIKL